MTATASPTAAPAVEKPIQTLHIAREELIEAPIGVVFQSLLDELGPEGQTGEGQPMPMKLEAFPGGRWIRDLGNNAGHFWGHVQVIKPPALLEISGPMMMSYAATNHVQYRLVSEGSGTRLKLTHQAFGFIPAEHREGLQKGWGFKLDRVKQLATRRHSK